MKAIIFPRNIDNNNVHVIGMGPYASGTALEQGGHTHAVTSKSMPKDMKDRLVHSASLIMTVNDPGGALIASQKVFEAMTLGVQEDLRELFEFFLDVDDGILFWL